MGEYDICSRCIHAYKSTALGSLTLLQVIVFGDGWAYYAAPLVEDTPLAVMAFLGCHITTMVELMNLVLAVIVDQANESRLQDESRTLAEKETTFRDAKESLTLLLNSLDKNRDGDLDREEFYHAAVENPHFARTLQLMDVTIEDFNNLFDMTDKDQSGTVDAMNSSRYFTR